MCEELLLSQILTERIGSNFFNYINGYRVEEAKRLPPNPEIRHYSIAAIGFEVGFNSLSMFNTMLNKLTRSTSSLFRLKLEDIRKIDS